MSKGIWVTGQDDLLQCPDRQTVRTTDWRGQITGHDADFFIIDTTDLQQASEAVYCVRRKLVPAVYLKPLVFLGREAGIPHELEQLSDFVCSRQQIETELPHTTLDAIAAINHQINRLQERKIRADTSLALRVLRYCFTRDLELKPEPSIQNRGGYSYPGIDALFERDDEGVWKTLEFLRTQHLLKGRFITRTHQCSSCGCAFLNFKETCPHCSSEDLHVDELVHHFRCGYTAELADFKQQGQLVCPKCDRSLRLIGVDYDKPSVIYRCNSCSHSFQDPEVVTTCYDCQRSAPPEHQELRTVEACSLTSLGENAALFGLDSLFAAILERRFGLLSLEIFERFLQVEKARITRYRRSASSLLLLDIQGLEQFYMELGERTTQVYEELANLFIALLRTSDLLSSRNESLFVILLTETQPREAQIVFDRLKNGIEELLEASLGKSPHLISQVLPVEQTLDLTDVLEQFIRETHAG